MKLSGSLEDRRLLWSAAPPTHPLRNWIEVAQGFRGLTPLPTTLDPNNGELSWVDLIGNFFDEKWGRATSKETFLPVSAVSGDEIPQLRNQHSKPETTNSQHWNYHSSRENNKHAYLFAAFISFQLERKGKFLLKRNNIILINFILII